MYEELEKKWKKYRLKKFSKIGITVFLALFVVISIYLLLENSKNRSSYSAKKMAKKENLYDVEKINSKSEGNGPIEKNLSQNSSKKSKNNIVKKETNNTFLPAVNKKNYEKAVSYLVPDYNFEKKLNIAADDLKSKEQIKIKKKVPLVSKKTIEPKVVSSDIKPKILITKSKNKNFINSLKEKFTKEKDPKIALFLSKYYYKKGDYKNSLRWAVRANELDSQNEESWIIFAKSSVKLGRKKDAIKALKTFISSHASFKARDLLNDIETGVFK